MRSFFLSSAVVGLLGLFAVSAEAHIQINYPTPREGTAVPELKTAPCGTSGLNRSTDPTRITTFRPGETIMVRFTETIDHPGHFRIAFDDSGQDAFQDPASFTDIQTNPVLPVLVDGIADKVGQGNQYQVSVTLPQITCNNCTLQVIQVMTDKPPYVLGTDDVYHQCADIILSNAGDGGIPSGTANDAGARDAAGGGSGGAGGAPGSGGAGGAPGTGGTTNLGGQSGTGGASAGTGGSSTGTGGVSTGSGGASPGTAGATTGSGGASNGTGGASGSVVTGGAAGDSNGANPPMDDGGGCALTASPRSSGMAAFVGGLLLAARFARRRRRAR